MCNNNYKPGLKGYEEQTEIERCLLGSALQGASLPEFLTVDMFKSPMNQTIFLTLKALKDTCVPDISVLHNELRNKGELDKAGGASYISELTSLVPSSCNIDYYAKELSETYYRHSVNVILASTQEELSDGKPLDEITMELPKQIQNIEAKRNQIKNGKEIGITFNDLIKKEFPLAVWVVEQLITIGLTILYGASKIGKSWFALQLVVAIDRGIEFMNSLATKEMGVLYLSLEDTPPRIKKRLEKNNVYEFNQAYLITDWKYEPSYLRQYLLDNPHFKVVVIDTLQIFAKINNLNDYNDTVNALSEIKKIADDLEVAIIVLHHTIKRNEAGAGDWMDGGLGSMGINGTADCSILLSRKRDSNDGFLRATGRDIEEQHLELKWSSEFCTWTLLGEVPKEQLLPAEQQKILQLLTELVPPVSTSTIVGKTGKKDANVINLLNKLVKAGLVTKVDRGLWALPPEQGCSEFTFSLPLIEE